MGNSEINKPRGLGDALFSKTQRQVLSLLFGQPDRSFYSKEIVELAGVGIGTVHRELEKLSGVGLLSVKRIGNQKHFQANPNSPIFDELKGIVRKTFGLTDVLREALNSFQDKVKVAFIYGSIAKGTDNSSSDIDIMIISDHLTYPDFLTNFSEVESNVGRTVNPTIYSAEEFVKKISAGNTFLVRVIEQPKIFLIGSKDDIPAV